MRRIHKVCQYLLRTQCVARGGKGNKVCQECPARVQDPECGTVVKGCYIQARELLNLATTGSVWTKVQQRRQREFRRKQKESNHG